MANDWFYYGADKSDMLANVRGQVIDIFHIPTGRSVKFKAFVTAFSDKYTSDWTAEDVYGRMDPIQTFKKTSRKISLGWEVVAGSLEEAVDNLERCTELFQMLYPVYAAGEGSISASSITAGPLFRLRFTNLLQDVSNAPSPGSTATAADNGLIGTMSGFTYEPDFQAGVFAVGSGTIYPQTIKLQCDYTVNHTHGLGFDDSGEKREPVFPYNVQSDPIEAVLEFLESGATGEPPSGDDVATEAEAEAVEGEVTE